MRIAVDIKDAQLRDLDELSKQEKRSRAALIREAIDDYLVKRSKKSEGDAFGLWKNRRPAEDARRVVNALLNTNIVTTAIRRDVAFNLSPCAATL